MVLLWAILFFIFPADTYTDALDLFSRIMWMGACGVGATAAAVGAFLRVDLKLELPGLAVMFIGPLFYFTAQMWFIYFLDAPPHDDVVGRIPLAVYAILPVFLCLPRVYSLGKEIRRTRARVAEALAYRETEVNR